MDAFGEVLGRLRAAAHLVGRSRVRSTARSVRVGELVDSLRQQAGLVLFVWVLANQAGVPVPATPLLLAAGALVSKGALSVILLLAVVVGAALIADLVWYGVGRWRGAQALAAVGRLLRQPHASVERLERFFLTHRFRFLLGVRFFPELNPIGAGLAGATRVRPACFLLSAVGSALVWAGAWAGVGYLLGEAIIR